MNLFYLHPDDRRWLKRWLRNNLVCFAAIAGFLLLLRVSTSAVQPEPINPAGRGVMEVVQPDGWRRTNQGWQHTSRWHLTPAADNERAVNIASVQPFWATMTMDVVRSTSPLVIALIQITAVASIIWISRRRQFAS